jgi:hypothetical protein
MASCFEAARLSRNGRKWFKPASTAEVGYAGISCRSLDRGIIDGWRFRGKLPRYPERTSQDRLELDVDLRQARLWKGRLTV